MEIHINEGEKLTIYAKSPGGETKTFPLSYEEMMERGEVIVDGLTQTEIDYLRGKKKIHAVKNHRARTGVGLKESKEAVEEWVERNNCCRGWPYCEHMAIIEHLDIIRLSVGLRSLSYIWKYPEELTIEQAKALMSLNGYESSIYGFYSFIVENGETRWASNTTETKLD